MNNNTQLDEFFAAFERATAPGPLKATRIFDGRVELEILTEEHAGVGLPPNGVYLGHIVAKPSRQGTGPGLWVLTSLADRYQIAISLEATPLSGEEADVARLVEFYKNLILSRITILKRI